MYRLVGTQQWTIMDTHNNKTSYKLTVLKPDTTYQVKILTQCLSKLHKTNEVITVRTPEGCELLFFVKSLFGRLYFSFKVKIIIKKESQ